MEISIYYKVESLRDLVFKHTDNNLSSEQLAHVQHIMELCSLMMNEALNLHCNQNQLRKQFNELALHLASFFDERLNESGEMDPIVTSLRKLVKARVR